MKSNRQSVAVIIAIFIALCALAEVQGKPHGVAVYAPVVAVPYYAPVYPYYAVPNRCVRKPHKCHHFYGQPPPLPPPPPRPYYGYRPHPPPIGAIGGVGVAAVGVGVVVGK